MVARSRVHHYLPQFYLKGFCNDGGTFHIYLIKEKRFKRKGALFSPASHFFTEYGNTFFDSQPNYLENLYRDLEDKASKIFEKIKSSSESNYGLEGNDFLTLQHFVSNLYWRVPGNIGTLSSLLNTKELKELGWKIVDEITGDEIRDEAEEERIITNPFFQKSLKFTMPISTLHSLSQCDTPVHVIPFPVGNIPALCSDNPVVLRNPEKVDLYRDDFIVPITQSKVLIRAHLKHYLNDLSKIEIDLLVLKQASEFVCCTDKTYIEMLEELFDKRYRTVDVLRRSVFANLIRTQ